jgi:hypothetical protein
MNYKPFSSLEKILKNRAYLAWFLLDNTYKLRGGLNDDHDDEERIEQIPEYPARFHGEQQLR